MERSRILYILTNLAFGGAQIGTSDICVGLRERGLNIEAVYSSQGGKGLVENDVLRDKLALAGVPLHDVRSMSRPIRPLRDVRAFFELRRLIRRLRPLIVHTHMSKAGVLGRLAAAAEGVPVIVHTVHGWSFDHRQSGLISGMYKALERVCARRAHHLTAVSSLLIEDAWKAGIPPMPNTVIRPGVDLTKFRARGLASAKFRARYCIPENAFVVGSIMNLTESKAPLDFVRVAALVAAAVPEARFVIAGDGPLAQAVRAETSRLGLDGKLHLAGLHSEVAPVLGMMDVFLMTSCREGLPRVIIEAMAAGVSVVTTRVGAVRELVGNGETGFIAAPGDIRELAQHTVVLLRDHALRRSCATRACQRVGKEFDLAVVIDAHERLYQSLLCGKEKELCHSGQSS